MHRTSLGKKYFRSINIFASAVLALVPAVSGWMYVCWLDDKIADLEGGMIGKLRKEDQKINRLTQILREKKVLTDSDVSELQELKVFPH